jgi:hypothetical protein
MGAQLSRDGPPLERQSEMPGDGAGAIDDAEAVNQALEGFQRQQDSREKW